MKYIKLINKITAKTFTRDELLDILNKIEDLKKEYHQETDEDEKLELKKEISNYIELTKNATIKGALDFGDTKIQIKTLPENLTIEGYCYLNHYLKELPKNLKIDGNLYLGLVNKIKFLPNDLQVKGNIINFIYDKSKVPEHLKNKI
jgi:hypothetical protein